MAKTFTPYPSNGILGTCKDKPSLTVSLSNYALPLIPASKFEHLRASVNRYLW